jgi:hypothetical protein
MALDREGLDVCLDGSSPRAQNHGDLRDCLSSKPDRVGWMTAASQVGS